MRNATPLLLATSLALAAIAPAAAQPAGELPEKLKNVGITERLNQKLTIDADFVDHTGKEVKLGDYFKLGRPVILTLNYFRCPSLCTRQLNGLIDALRVMDWTPGEQFEIVTISFAPEETWELAAHKRENYLLDLGRPEADKGWHFLTGRAKNIDQILEDTGYRVAWDEDEGQWVHAAALIICTPDGHISRYLPGLVYNPKTLRMSLVEASEGKIGSAVDQIYLFCYHYDPELGKYTASAAALAKIGAGGTLLAVGALLAVLWRSELRRRAKNKAAGADA